MKIAMVQLRVDAGHVAENRSRGIALAAQAAANADIVVLPEIWTTGYALREVAKWAETVEGPTVSELQNISREYSASIISGSLPLLVAGKVFNAGVVITAGEIAARYQKIHLFSMYGEERFFAPGSKRCIFPLGAATGGLAICYDLRFPELFRAMTADGATILFLPAEWPTARGEHWRVLNQARALENQVFMCAVNCVGQFKGGNFYGHSLLVGPDGAILAEGSDQEEIVYAEADFTLVHKMREGMPVWRDRRPDAYL